ncbi:MAG TPA: hypothetical protein PKY30_18370, partial [Myxococcota bacterium]|nr:hypothetical protein [Myxococcota bacterium]
MSDPLPPRLVLDQELLARLGPQSSRAEWERTLKRTGLATVEPGQTRAGKLLSAIQRGVQAWPTGAPPEAPIAAELAPWLLGIGGVTVLLGGALWEGW